MIRIRICRLLEGRIPNWLSRSPDPSGFYEGWIWRVSSGGPKSWDPFGIVAIPLIRTWLSMLNLYVKLKTKLKSQSDV